MTRPPFPSPPLAVSDQLDRSPAVATLTMTTTLVAGADTTPADRKLPGQSWYTVGDASHQDYNGLQPFLQLFLQPCCGPQCYSHLYAVASKPCYAPLRIAAIFLLPSFSHSQRLSTAAMAKFLLWPGLYHIRCSYYFNLPLVMSGTCHSCLDTEAVLPVSEDVPVGHLQHHLGGDPERG